MMAICIVTGLARPAMAKSAAEIDKFFFDQKGLMAGLGIQGSKITKITPK